MEASMTTAEFGPRQEVTTDDRISTDRLLTVHEILTASASSRLRDSRNERFRGNSVLRHRRTECRGTFEYKIADSTTPVGPSVPPPAIKAFIEAVIVPALLERLRREQAPTKPNAA
jgi:hypothetical protein